MSETSKQKLLDATVELLQTDHNVERATARNIAALAGVNQAMINYHYGSKDALVKLAVDRVIYERAEHLRRGGLGEGTPHRQLRRFLIDMALVVLEYESITRPPMPYVILECPLDTPLYILPLVRECCPARGETECRVIAYELIAFIQLVFYRREDFTKYAGLSGEEPQQVIELIDMQLRLLLGADHTEEWKD